MAGAGGLAAMHSSGPPSRGAETEPGFDPRWQAHVDTGIYPPRTHLFLDDHHVEDSDNVRRLVHCPTKVSPRPLFRHEMPWEGVSVVFRNSVIYDASDRVFKLWYRGYDPKLKSVSHSRWCLATSSDGLHWERPQLGAVAFGGAKRNNIISFGEQNDHNALLHNVVRDDREENPARRFKAIGMDAHPVQAGDIEVPYLKKTGFKTAGGLFAAYSADGVHWRMRPGWLAGMFLRDGSTLHGWNHEQRRWVLWQRPAYRRGIRMIGVSYSQDFERWSVPEMGLVPDDTDPQGMQFDQLTSVASSDGGYIGLLSASGWSGRGFSSGEEMPQLVYSRDPRSWTRVSREMFIKPGSKGAWDEGTVIPANPIVVGDDVYCFYYGKNAGGAWGEPTNDGRGITTSALGLAKMRRDRWVSMSPTGKDGILTTSDVFFSGDQLRVNVDASRGSLRAELVDYHGQPVEPYTLANCQPITGDVMDHQVTWKTGGARFTSSVGTAKQHPPEVSRCLRIRFALDQADLFSFSC